MGWKPAEAIGKEISSGLSEKSNNLLIIGVVKDFHYGGVKMKFLRSCSLITKGTGLKPNE